MTSAVLAAKFGHAPILTYLAEQGASMLQKDKVACMLVEPESVVS